MPRTPKHCYSHSIPGGLPRQVTFKAATGEESLLTNMVYIEEEHIPAVFSLTRQAAEAGLNVGLDEYETEDALVGVLDLGPTFVFLDATSPGPDSVLAALALPALTMQRSFRPHTCDLRVLLSPAADRLGGFAAVLRLAEGLLDEMPELLFDSAAVAVFAPNYAYMRALRVERYHPALIVPQNGCVKGMKAPQDSVVYYKDIRENIPTRSWDEMCEQLAAYDEFETFDVASASFAVPFLPVRHVFKNGREMTLRNCRTGEDEHMYRCVSVYAGRGEGYTPDDFPTLNTFRGYFLAEHYIAVVEQPDTGGVVGYLIMGASEASRSCREKLLADTSLVIDPEYQAQGFGLELMAIGLGIMKDVGYLATMSDLLISNLAMFNLTTRLGYSKCGFNPKSAYIDGEGWVDGVFTHMDLVKGKSFIKDLHLPPKNQVETKV